MSPVTSLYPPPLSSPPTVEALERLLAGLDRPLERGVPSPPAVDLTDDVLFGDEGPAGEGLDEPGRAAEPTAQPAIARSPSPSLTWSAHHGHARRGGAITTPAGLVATTVAAALATAIAAGLHLP